LEGLDSLRACRWPVTSLDRSQLSEVRAAAALHAGYHAVLETCQRLEVYSLGDCNCDPARSESGFDALSALTEVAAGLDAIVLGEDQVFGQVRKMLLAAPHPIRRHGLLALATAREFRRTYSNGNTSGQLLDAALKATCTKPSGRLLVIGTGHMARLVVRRAVELGFEDITVAGRSAPASDWIAAANARFVHTSTLKDEPPFDIVAGCLGKGAELIDIERQLPPVGRLVIDLGTPRTFADTASVRLIDIAQLEQAQHPEDRAERDRLRGLLRDQLARRVAMWDEDHTSPVGELRLSVERIRQRELRRMERLNPEIPAETLDTLTRSLVNQLFHTPSERLRQLKDPILADQLLDLFREESAAPPLSQEGK
jgi:glutamyl-tRNA reductase